VILTTDNGEHVMRQTYVYKKREKHGSIRRPLRIVKENAYEFAILSGKGNIFLKKLHVQKAK
jgi:hypothetical protein